MCLVCNGDPAQCRWSGVPSCPDYSSHYKWLDKYLPVFFAKLNIIPNHPASTAGIISAHGDKCYTYRDKWEKAGVHFFHGVAIYLCSYLNRYSDEVRDTPNGWVDPSQWVIDNYREGHKFAELLRSINPDVWQIIDANVG